MTMTRHMYYNESLDLAKMRDEARRHANGTHDKFSKPGNVIIHMHRAIRGTSISDVGCPLNCSETREVYEAIEPQAKEKEADPVVKDAKRTCEYCGRSVPMNERCSCPEGSRPVTIEADGTVRP